MHYLISYFHKKKNCLTFAHHCKYVLSNMRVIVYQLIGYAFQLSYHKAFCYISFLNENKHIHRSENRFLIKTFRHFSIYAGIFMSVCMCVQLCVKSIFFFGIHLVQNMNLCKEFNCKGMYVALIFWHRYFA